MSSPSITDSLNVPASGERSLRDLVAGPVKRAAFWAAIALPFLHVPLLVTGLDSPTTTLAFGALVALNVLAVLVGQHHDFE